MSSFLRLTALSLLFVSACGDDGSDGEGGEAPAACASYNAQLKECGSSLRCENELDASCFKKYPKAAMCGGFSEAFQDYISCRAAPSNK